MKFWDSKALFAMWIIAALSVLNIVTKTLKVIRGIYSENAAPWPVVVLAHAVIITGLMIMIFKHKKLGVFLYIPAQLAVYACTLTEGMYKGTLIAFVAFIIVLFPIIELHKRFPEMD